MKKKKIWVEKDGYLVNRDGSIYKLNWGNTGTMRKVKQTKENTGYLRFNCNGKNTLAHRFIAECFLPNPQNLPCVNHKDENKQNNCVENLEWCTHKYNLNYGTRNERAGESIKNHPKKSKKVLQFTKDGKFVKEWASTMEIQRVMGYAHQHISACCNGKLKSAYDHLWYYKPLSALSESNNSPRVK